MAHTRANAESVALEAPDSETLALRGALTFATAAVTLAQAGRMLASGRQTRLDLGGVTRADSAGLACVIALIANVRDAGRALQVVRWPEGLRALAEVCEVADLLDSPAA